MGNVPLYIVFRPSNNEQPVPMDRIVEELVKSAIRKALAKHPGTSCTDDIVMKPNSRD